MGVGPRYHEMLIDGSLDKRGSHPHPPATPTEDQRLLTLDRKDGTEQLRVEIREFRGTRYVDIRCWWRDEHGEWKPGKGCTVRLHELSQVRDALGKAANMPLQRGGQRMGP